MLNVTAVWTDVISLKYAFDKSNRALTVNITNWHMYNFLKTKMFKEVVKKYAKLYSNNAT
jgi:hypothetical protein